MGRLLEGNGKDTMGASSMIKPIRLEARGPIIIITYLGGCTDEQYEEYLRSLTKMIGEVAVKHHQFAQIHDASAWTSSTARQRTLQANWIKEHMPLLRQRGGYCAFVFKSVVVRGGLTAVMWLVEMPGPYTICATLDEALRWSERQVASPPASRTPSIMPRSRP